MPTSFDPTEEQRDVIAATDRAMVVTAAAGAGKTAVLVQRYLRHVDEGVAPDAILTITFTKKAAAEMKRRIIRELRTRGLMREAQIAETGPIQTIHSFCERLLRENALEAGLDPRFDIASDGQAGQMIERVIRDTITLPFSEPEADALMSFLAGQRTYGGTSPYAKLETSIRELLSRLRGSGLDIETLETEYTDADRLKKKLESIMLAEQPLPVAEHARRHSDEHIAERIKNAYKDWGQKAPQWSNANPDPAADTQAIDHTAGLFQLCARAWLLLEREMEREQKLDFTALEERALRLLRQSQPTRDRLQRQYQFVMVDEAQDVNPIQYELLQAMEIESEMLVGDAQQSIYGFRLADPRLFLDRVESTEPKRLSLNMRSQAGILRFVDDIFGALWEGYVPMKPPPSPLDLNVIEPPAYRGVEVWELADKDTTATAVLVKEMVAEQEVKLSEIALLVRDAGFAQEMQSALRAAGVPSRIAGGTERFYSRLEIRDLANTLRALGDPYDDFALLAMLRSPVAGLSLDAIALLTRSKPVISALPEFVSPVEEDAGKLKRCLEWFLPLSACADRLSAWEVLSELFAVSDYLPTLARRRNAKQLLANVRKLLVLATQEPELGPVEYAERIREIQNLRHREGDAPAEDDKAELITIMTIHKAKGLEWPVVIVPQMHKPMGKRTGDMEVNARLKLAVTKFGRRPSVYYNWLHQEAARRDHEEELRLLYVALTRAKERLCVVAHQSAKPGTLAKLVAGKIGLGKATLPGLTVRAATE